MSSRVVPRMADGTCRGAADEGAPEVAILPFGAAALSDAEVEEAPAREGQVGAKSAPVSILKNRKHTEPPPCLDRLELEGDTGRKALIMEVQAVLRSSHGSEPSPEEVREIQQKYSIDPQDVMSVFTYFRELMCTFSKSIRE